MTFKNFCFIFCLGFGILFSFIGCNNNNPVTPDNPFENFRYPYQNGMSWFYNNKILFYNIRPDSARNYISEDTVSGYGISIYTNDTIINGVTSKLLRSEHVSPTHAHTTLESFIQTDTGLISTFGGKNGRSFGPYRPNPNIKFVFDNKEFNNVEDIFYYKDNLNPDTLMVDTTRVNCIKYPVSEGTEWLFNDLGSGLRVYKKYTGIVDVNTPLGTLKCMQVQRIYKTGSVPDTSLVFYDYLSEKGMIKRDYAIKNVQIYNSAGQHIGFFDIKEEYTIELINGF